MQQDASLFRITNDLNVLNGKIFGNVIKEGDKPLELTIDTISNGVLRVTLDETHAKRWRSPDVVREDTKFEAMEIISQDSAQVTIASKSVRARIDKSKFRVEVLDVSGSVVAIINDQGLLHYNQEVLAKSEDSGSSNTISEESKPKIKDKANGRTIVDWGEDGKPIYADGEGDAEDAAEDRADVDISESLGSKSNVEPERFGGHTDFIPRGSMSLGVDITFPGTKHIYGIPEHATDFNLKTTREGSEYDEPFRMYNLDVFEYEIDVPMALYGHIPMAIAHSAKQSTGVFWHNPSETFVDITNSKRDGSKQIRWMSETGVFELMVMVGPKPNNVFTQFASVTGTTPLPPMFSLGYHQCRWNYRDEKDVREVNAGFEEHDIPYDVIWLDIEHTDGKRYFTWDEHKFPTPLDMQANIKHYGRKMVTIVDPHIKRANGYHIHEEATRLGYYIKDKDGNDFKGWCWPGDSSYLDFTSKQVRSWWAEQFGYDKYKGSTDILYTWNDMNEPSVFNGPEVSMDKQSKSITGVEHREWHNLYGFYQHMATADGLVKRNEGHVNRPFVLSRAFFAGSQRHGAIWTGDNAAEWSHLAIASHMILSLNVAGLPFAGADIGGFFKNPSVELLVRWYFAAAFQPFFRGHSHIDTNRREPWLFGPEATAQITKAIRLRYSFLPFWYTVFYEHEVTGLPVMRPLWSLAPEDEATFTIGDSWLVGDSILVKPVVAEGATSTMVYFPKNTNWFEMDQSHRYFTGGQSIDVQVPIDHIPVYQRAGSIIPRRLRNRRSTLAMYHDPYTVYVAPENHIASGSLYVDDEMTFAYKSGKFCIAKFEYDGVSFLATTSSCGIKVPIQVERIVIMGWKSSATPTIKLESTGESLLFEIHDETITIRKPIKSFFEVPFKLFIQK